METAVLDLEQYKTAPVKISSDELTKINNKLEELAQDFFPIEEEARQKLIYQKALYTYPKFNTDFLSLSAEREWKYKDNMGYDKITNIKVPRFSVHRLDESKMIMRFNGNKNRCEAWIISPNNLPKIISIPLLKTTEFFDENFLYKNDEEKFIYLDVGKCFFDVKSFKEIFKKYREIGRIEIQRAFNGLIPVENKKTIREAQKVFGNEIFIFAEAKPEDWNIRKYIEDPIVAGVIKNECFYIDKFNTTPLEDFVKTGFSQTN